ncbi:TPA: hypothetical protein ACJTYV_001533 [Streptococcus pyogenes]|uniref:hypothetical protein n=1 Tax=Streptococcus pyogenes TaxID=1314 RepID=UPI00101399B6|nr:hypothetical protein [Streptococcus pyogenes]HER4540996.1 hypothetical protein [Streptococcus pyogenes NGAS719]HER4556191.1 hypothetical protein [Streptococcus pyogenes NGAS717]HER4692534.1 hypothetical protein [Streptococcus pyogenes NGAS372]QAX74976.1 hypothetical protein D8S77_07515 [Streptococcus pyogenes]UQB41246.1 hypothetical protein JF649_01875 [Streptococcus pyogenes]
MKTRSKHFLNLATLCLALIGTTLLMAQPVKAEMSEAGHDSVTVSSVGLADDGAYDKGHDAGSKAGYQAGLQSSWNESEPPSKDNIPEPSENPYEGNERDKADYKQGFRDGYPGGYVGGWRESHPIEATLQYLWYTVSSWFESLFNNSK